MKYKVKHVRSFFGLGAGIERWNCLETGMTWHAKVYIGPWVVLIDPGTALCGGEKSTLKVSDLRRKRALTRRTNEKV